MAVRAKTPRVGLVLGAGGYAGQAFHAGVLAALVEATGWEPRQAEVVVGTSAGSATGAAIRAGFAAEDLFQRAIGGPLSREAEEIVRGHPSPRHAAPMRRRSLRPTSLSPLRRGLRDPRGLTVGAVVAGLMPEGVRATEFIEESTNHLLDSRWPEQALWVCTVHLDTGERVVFGRDDAPAATPGRAVAASCSVPSVFAPVTIDGDRYVDGGAHSSTNADLVADLDLDLVIVSVPMSRSGNARRRTLDLPGRAFTRMLLAREIIPMRAAGTPVVTFPPTDADIEVMAGRALDPSCRTDVARQAHESTVARLARPAFRKALEALRPANVA